MDNSEVHLIDEIDHNLILFDINGFTNFREELLTHKNCTFMKYPVPYADYSLMFSNIQKEILAGNTYLINLTCATPIETNLKLKEIFLFSRAKYKLLYHDLFVVFSPETFVKIRENRIESYPMKGTIDASLPGAEQLILNDPKEKAEHYTITDLIRNDLSTVANEVRVEQFRYLDIIETNQKRLIQVSSKISGKLDKSYNKFIGEIMFRLLPAGSVTGAPKKKTVEIIQQAENYNRGYYTGVFGIFDGENIDCGVMIRFIEKNDSKFIYKSGGGITMYSDCLSEYNEMIDKIYVPFV